MEETPKKGKSKIDFPDIIEKTILSILIFFLIFAALIFSITNFHYQEFVYLADAFLHGSLSFREIPGSFLDVALFQNHMYWQLGPFPSILLMPFVAIFGVDFMQGYFQFFLLLGNFYLLYCVALRLGMKKKINALWLALVYLFGTAYIEVAFNSNSWRFAHAVATFFILLALLEYLKRKRFWVIGILLACVVATRLHIILGSIFFLLAIVLQKISWKQKGIYLAQLLLPIGAVLILLGGYNYLRFDDVFNTGYLLSAQTNILLNIRPSWATALKWGNWKMFSPAYLPTNVYTFFLKGLNPVLVSENSYLLQSPFITKDQYGVSMFITSPIFLLALLGNIKERIIQQSWLAALFIFIPILFFFGPTQRYILDCAPFLFIILVKALVPKFQFPIKAFIVFCILLSFILQYSETIVLK